MHYEVRVRCACVCVCLCGIWIHAATKEWQRFLITAPLL